jgi:predicted transcriptional regulator
MKNNLVLLDGIDKDILRVLTIRSPMVGRQIAKFVGLSSSAISLRLEKLEGLGILRKAHKDCVRCFERTYNGRLKKIKSPRSISWALDLEVKK